MILIYKEVSVQNLVVHSVNVSSNAYGYQERILFSVSGYQLEVYQIVQKVNLIGIRKNAAIVIVNKSLLRKSDFAPQRPKDGKVYKV